MKHRHFMRRAPLALLFGNLILSGGALAGGPVVDRPAMNFLNIQRAVETGIPGCIETATLSNQHPTRGILVKIVSTQHILAGEIRQEIIRVVFPQSKTSLGCSWWKGALAPTDLQIVGATFGARRIDESRPAEEQSGDDVGSSSVVSSFSCQGPLLYERLDAGGLLEQQAWFAGHHVAVMGVVAVGQKECLPQECTEEQCCQRCRAPVLLGNPGEALIELEAGKAETAGCDNDSCDKAWKCTPGPVGHQLLAWGIWSPTGHPGVLVMEGYCDQ